MAGSSAEPTERVLIAAVVMLGLVLIAAVVGLTVAAVQTDRNLWRAEVLTFGGMVLLASIGGAEWLALRRHRWRVSVDRNGNGGTE